MSPSSTTGFRPKRLFLFSIPKTPPPGQRKQGQAVSRLSHSGGGFRQVASLTQDLADADEDAGDADQTLGVVAEAGHGADAGAVHAAVKRQLQTWRRSRRRGGDEYMHTHTYTTSR